jgi:hypothetical protein
MMGGFRRAFGTVIFRRTRAVTASVPMIDLRGEDSRWAAERGLGRLIQSRVVFSYARIGQHQ